MVAGQDDDRLSQPVELGSNEGDGLVGHAVVIEEVAGDQQQIGPVCQRPIDDPPKDGPAALGVRSLLGRTAVAVAVQMHVGGVKNTQGSSGGRHAQEHAIFRVEMVD